MNIEELEFIRDFSENLEMLEKDISNISLICESNIEEEQQELIHFNLESIHHQSQLIRQYFCIFKRMVDIKYSDVWKAANPHMQDIKAP